MAQRTKENGKTARPLLSSQDTDIPIQTAASRTQPEQALIAPAILHVSFTLLWFSREFSPLGTRSFVSVINPSRLNCQPEEMHRTAPTTARWGAKGGTFNRHIIHKKARGDNHNELENKSHQVEPTGRTVMYTWAKLEGWCWQWVNWIGTRSLDSPEQQQNQRGDPRNALRSGLNYLFFFIMRGNWSRFAASFFPFNTFLLDLPRSTWQIFPRRGSSFLFSFFSKKIFALCKSPFHDNSSF